MQNTIHRYVHKKFWMFKTDEFITESVTFVQHIFCMNINETNLALY